MNKILSLKTVSAWYINSKIIANIFHLNDFLTPQSLMEKNPFFFYAFFYSQNLKCLESLKVDNISCQKALFRIDQSSFRHHGIISKSYHCKKKKINSPLFPSYASVNVIV